MTSANHLPFAISRFLSEIYDMGERGVLGLDIGGTKTLCALVDEAFHVLEEIKFATAPSDGRKSFVKELIQTLQALARAAKQKKMELIGIGAGFAGLVDKKNCSIKTAPNIRCLEGLALGETLREALKLPTTMGNDVQLGLYGEHQAGAAVDCPNVLGVFFGTGVGGAAIIDGRLHEGASGFGGQVGCLLTHHIGGPEMAESHGILDRIASKSAIGAAALAMVAKQSAPHLFAEVGTDLAQVSWGALRRAIEAGDDQIEELVKGRMKIAGITLSSVVNFLNPEMVVLGGGLTEEMPKLVVSGVEQGLREYLVPEVAEALKVKPAKLKNRAGVMGAAKAAFDRFG